MTLKEKTAFIIPGRRLFQFTRMPQVLNSAAAVWQRFIDQVLGFDLQPKCFVYLDDVVLVSSSFEEHLTLLETVLTRLEAANLTMNLEKCKFCMPELRYLGYLVDKEGLRIDPKKLRPILEFPKPNTISEARRFNGLLGTGGLSPIIRRSWNPL